MARGGVNCFGTWVPNVGRTTLAHISSSEVKFTRTPIRLQSKQALRKLGSVGIYRSQVGFQYERKRAVLGVLCSDSVRASNRQAIERAGEETHVNRFGYVAAGLLLSLPAAAHTPQQPPHQLYSEGDLKLKSGEAIKDFSISYVTHGKLNEKKSNAILMVTAVGGNHHRIDFMIGPGKALDPDKYFIICTDAIANGLSTSPSNSKAQPRTSLPKFTIRDMVESQYRLLKEKFGIDHVVAVVGPSMGGMQVLQWGVSHPDFMDALVTMVPLAKTPAWTVAVLEASRKAIVTDPAWKDGNYDALPEKGVRLWRDILNLLAARTSDMYETQFKSGIDVLPWMEQQETAAARLALMSQEVMDEFEIVLT
jgi:homoserine acetyltransferase